MTVGSRNYWRMALAVLLLAAAGPALPEESKTVLGPSNIYLYDGANALRAGDGAEGVRLTLLGLSSAQGMREEKIAHANLCAGYLLVDQPEKALQHCNWVLDRDDAHWRTYNNRALVYLHLERFEESEADIRRGQELRPKSTNLKIVKGMLLDETNPVTTRIEADDRRDAAERKDGETDRESEN